MDACTCANHEARDPPAVGAARLCGASCSRPHPSACSHATNTRVAGIPVHASLFATDTHAQSCIEMWHVTKPQQLQCASPCYTRRACLLMRNALQLMMQHPVRASLLGLQVAPLFLQCRRHRPAVSSTSWRLLAFTGCWGRASCRRSPPPRSRSGGCTSGASWHGPASRTPAAPLSPAL